LVAHGRTVEEVATEIGTDRLIFQDLDDLISAVRKGNSKLNSFDCSVFTGEYVTGDVNRDYLDHLQNQRSDNAKQERRDAESEEVIEMYNNA
jgi:amidophosphoribosyltransferase